MIRFWLINATRGYNCTSEPHTLEALQNAVILIYRCKIYPYYVYILLHEKASVLVAAVLMSYFFISFYYFHRFSWYQVTVNLNSTVELL